MTHSSMPRPKSANDTAISLLLPAEWLDEAQALAVEMTPPGASTMSRADALRMAIRRGMDALREERAGKGKRRRSGA